jgi:hypothetical protein
LLGRPVKQKFDDEQMLRKWIEDAFVEGKNDVSKGAVAPADWLGESIAH